MAKSISQLQNEVSESLIRSLSDDPKDYSSLNQLPVTERLIIEYAAAFIQKVQENLKRLNKIDTGTLSSEITQGELIKSGGKYELEVGYPADGNAAKYYDFVNKGVKGFKSGSPNSPYSFKSGTPSLNGPMVTAIQKWVKRQGLTSRRETQGSTFSSLQRKRKAISELNTGRQTAWLIARSIKRKGLPKTGFFDEAVSTYFEGPEFAQAMAKAVGGDVRVYIREANQLLNNEKK